MLVAIDAGNTNGGIAAVNGEKSVAKWRASSDATSRSCIQLGR